MAMAIPIHIHNPHFHAPALPAWDMQRLGASGAWVGATLRDKEDGGRSGGSRAVDVRVRMTKGGKKEKEKEKMKKERLGVVVAPSPGIQCVVM